MKYPFCTTTSVPHCDIDDNDDDDVHHVVVTLPWLTSIGLCQNDRSLSISTNPDCVKWRRKQIKAGLFHLVRSLCSAICSCSVLLSDLNYNTETFIRAP